MILFTWNWLFALIISTIINLSSAAPASLSASAGAAFKNNSLLITNLSILDPFQADPKASDNSTLSLTVADPDYPDLSAVRCVLSWKAGMAPPSQAGIGCENTTTRVWFPQNTYKGVTNFQLEIAHLVLDSSVGQCPQYCALDKFASLNLTYPGTNGFDCSGNATCKQTGDAPFNAIVFSAVA